MNAHKHAAEPITPAQTRVRPSRRIVLGALAPEGWGKTHLVLTMPKPMVIIGIDPNTQAIVEQFFGVEDVADLDPAIAVFHHIPFPIVGLGIPDAVVQGQAEEAWFRVEDIIREIYEQKDRVDLLQPRSVMIDSGTQLDRLNTGRVWGRMDGIKPSPDAMRKKGIINKDMIGLYDMMERTPIHVGVTHRSKPRYRPVEGQEQDEVVPGVFDRVGFKEFGNLCNVEVLCLFDEDRPTTATTEEKQTRDKFGVRILRSRQRPALIGEESWGRDPDAKRPFASFASLAMRLYPGTTRSDWE